MSNRILVDATKPIPKLLLEGIDDLRNAIDKLNRVQHACDMMAFGETAPFPSLQTEMGIAATTSGNTAADFYSLLQSSLSATTGLNVDIVAELIRRCDQG